MSNTELIITMLQCEWGQKIASSIFNKAKNIYKDLTEKEKIQWGTAFDSYLKKTFESYSKTKTLLYRDTPVDIYQFYECIFLEKNIHSQIDTSNINNILNEGNKIFITGTGGIGKTIMLKHFYLDTIKNTNLIPVLIELRKINGNDIDTFNLKKYIIDNLKKSDLKLEDKYFEYTFEEGYYIFLFDGYDEIEEKFKTLIAKEIQDFTFLYDKNYFIISSRPSNELISWNDFLELKSLYLRIEQAISLINKLNYDEKVKTKFSKALKNGLFKKYDTFASIPLLLIIMLLTFEANASIPNKLNEFYEQAFSVLFHRHDATKGMYSRDIRSKLGYEDFKKAFSYFCFRTYFESKYDFTYSEIVYYIQEINDRNLEISKIESKKFLYDLINSICVILEDGLDYRFIHRSFQEYFAAIYIRGLNDKAQKTFFSQYFLNNRKNNRNFYQILYEIQKERFLMNLLQPFIQIVEKIQKKKMEEKDCSDKKALFDIFFPNFAIVLRKDCINSITKRGIDMFNTLEDFDFLIDSQFKTTIFFHLYPNLKEKYQNNLPKKLALDDPTYGKKLWEVLEENCIGKLYNDWNNLKNLCEKYCTINKNTSNFNELLKQL